MPQIDEIRQLVAQGRLSEAATMSRDLADCAPTVETLTLYGDVLQQAGRASDSVDVYRQAIERGGNHWELFLSLGRSLVLTGRFNEGTEALLRAHDLAPQDAGVSRTLIEALGRSRGPAASMAFWKASGGISGVIGAPAFSACCVELAREKLAQGNLAEAEVFCLNGLEVSDVGELYALLAYVQQQTGRNAEAIISARKAISLRVRDGFNSLTLGRSLLDLGRVPEALDSFRAAHDLIPDDFDVTTKLLEVDAAVNGLAHASDLFARIRARGTSLALERAWSGIAFKAGAADEAVAEGLSVRRQMTPRQWAERRGFSVTLVESQEDIPIEQPSSPLAATTPVVMTIPSNEPYVAELINVSISSGSHLVMTDDGFALNETGAHPEYGQYVDHHSDPLVLAQRGDVLLTHNIPNDSDFIDAGIMLSGVVSGAWGHWSVEYLPRLQFLEQHPEFAHLPIIVDEEMPQSHFDSLSLIVSNPLIKLKRGRGLKVGRLIYAPPATFFPVHVFPNPLPPYLICPASPRGYRYVRRRVEAKLGTRQPGGGKYYLSRRNSTWRRTHNEADVGALLKALGFKVVAVEDLTFEDQVRLFQDAAMIVAPMGSSLQNLIFASTSVDLIVLLQDNMHNQAAFNGQMGALGYRPRLVLGKAIGDANRKHADFVVPLEELRAAVRASPAAG